MMLTFKVAGLGIINYDSVIIARFGPVETLHFVMIW